MRVSISAFDTLSNTVTSIPQRLLHHRTRHEKLHTGWDWYGGAIKDVDDDHDDNSGCMEVRDKEIICRRHVWQLHTTSSSLFLHSNIHIHTVQKWCPPGL
jgi:hypothetical protein